MTPLYSLGSNLNRTKVLQYTFARRMNNQGMFKIFSWLAAALSDTGEVIFDERPFIPPEEGVGARGAVPKQTFILYYHPLKC
ncbi:unnamed protein product [Acanthoscelides obtectus]|uniref:Uncharacterized protein n=1 Tax=Acanthoscelides obtectus TaxID=200917 RepID=A0A9P0JRZ2_ACAOB|nr:unnamed protein product [Acanthoscelides obtectus]CAK1679253.1 hypothetical protein AOBTE_LOCUS32189 [Acanthoscelides obtectus]